MIQNKRDRNGTAYALGLQAENSFVSYATSKGWKIKKSTEEEDTRKHFDYTIVVGDKSFTVDVKSEKKISRGDSNTNADRIWIELQNVRGDIGWAYSEFTDLIAFQNGKEYLMIPRDELVVVVESLIQSVYVTRPYEALYKLYRRSGRNDLLTQVLKSDIVHLHKELV